MQVDPESLPPVFIQCFRQGTCTMCTTEEMASLSTRHTASVQEIFMMTVRLPTPANPSRKSFPAL